MSELSIAGTGDHEEIESLAGASPTALFWRRLVRTPAVAAGFFVIAAIVVVAVAAPLLSPYDPIYQDYTAVMQPPGGAHLLGTDDLGHDILSQLIYGARVSLGVGIASIAIASVLGTAMGLVSGYYGGWIDDVIMRGCDALIAFPALLLILALASSLGPSIVNATIAIGIVYSPTYSRLLRGQVLSLRDLDYVTAARALGTGDVRMMLSHILPNGMAPMIVLASLDVSGAILTEAALSFLGLGVPPPAPSWGRMLQDGYQFVGTALWISFFPGIAIFVTVLAFNIFGDGLRSILDPRSRI